MSTIRTHGVRAGCRVTRPPPISWLRRQRN